ncbi:MAG: PAS domain-containing protein [Thermoplasmata archaeon]|nr:PAS domain-containing protein [Thermoplasmata archaeon]
MTNWTDPGEHSGAASSPVRVKHSPDRVPLGSTLAMALTLTLGGRSASPRDDPDLVLSFFDHAPIALLVLDGSRRVQRANAATERLFGPSAEELRGRLFTALVEPRWRSAVDQAIDAVSARGDPFLGLSAEAQRADGSVALLEISIIRLSVGAWIGLGVVAREVRPTESSARPGHEVGGRATEPAYTLGELLMANRLRELI